MATTTLRSAKKPPLSAPSSSAPPIALASALTRSDALTTTPCSVLPQGATNARILSPSVTCPFCGGRKEKGSKRCMSCYLQTTHPELGVCPGCSGKKAAHATQCMECHLKDIAHASEVTCKNCSKVFTRRRGELRKNNENHFCSKACYFEHRVTHPKTPSVRGTCQVCSAPLTRKDQKKYCSRVCFHKAQTKTEEQLYSNGFGHMKALVLRRDRKQCVVCAATRALVVHHIDEDTANNLSTNLVTLCRGCHEQCHHSPAFARPIWDANLRLKAVAL